MSIRHGLLALLESGPRYGYQLRAEFEAHTGSTWPLNVGQVYTTLDRLARDGLVAAVGQDDAGRTTYAITDAGRAEVLAWFATPVRHSDRPRDELAIKLALAVTVPDVDVRQVVQAQRTESMALLRDYTRLKSQRDRQPGASETAEELAWSLVLESLVFAVEAEIRWLDHVESRLVQHAGRIASRPTGRASAPAVAPDDADQTAAARSPL
jgi:DNA-binding PadR family transcriptional regulator